MNFKTLLLSALALLSVANAAPVKNNTSYINSVKKACSYGSSELFYKINGDEASYACIHKYNPRKKTNIATPNNSACFYHNKNTYCVDRRYNTFEECDKTKKDFDYRKCSLNMISLKSDSDSISTSYFRTYPDKERIYIDYIQDQKECKARGGIVLTYKVMQQYICLYPETIKHSLKDKHCVAVEGKVYCVLEDNTIINTCNKQSKEYNHDYCMAAIAEYAKANGITVNEKGF